MPVDQQKFIVVCSLAFLTVFLLLGALAIAMRMITILFPERRTADTDVALVAAIASSVAAISPGARVVQIEEITCSPSPRPERSG
jgi:hypothetical protein